MRALQRRAHGSVANRKKKKNKQNQRCSSNTTQVLEFSLLVPPRAPPRPSPQPEDSIPDVVFPSYLRSTIVAARGGAAHAIPPVGATGRGCAGTSRRRARGASPPLPRARRAAEETRGPERRPPPPPRGKPRRPPPAGWPRPTPWPRSDEAQAAGGRRAGPGAEVQRRAGRARVRRLARPRGPPALPGSAAAGRLRGVRHRGGQGGRRGEGEPRAGARRAGVCQCRNVVSFLKTVGQCYPKPSGRRPWLTNAGARQRPWGAPCPA